MKRYWDLTERERAEMTREDVDKCVELMEKGVLAAGPLELVPIPSPGNGARRLYRVRTLDYVVPDIAFDTETQAQRFVACGAYHVRTSWDGHEAVAVADPISPSAVKIFSEDIEVHSTAEAKALAGQVRAAKAENARRKKEHDAATKAALSGLWADWHACGEKAHKLERIASTFQEYVATAGDAKVASRFLRKPFQTEDIDEACAWFPERMSEYVRQGAAVAQDTAEQAAE